MNDRDWRRLQKVYEMGLCLNGEDRQRLLEKYLNDNQELAKEVQAMWNCGGESFDFDSLAQMAMRAVLESGVSIDDKDANQAYEIIETIGVGGMATVYKARQLRPIQRIVALKVVPAELGSQENMVRFRAEQQALSLMAHRNIAVVYDAGVTSQGRPYFSMEYLPAIPITTFCDNNRLTIEKRLNLFLDVCEAIQHAHQKGVIHRDIHPGNILVDIQEGQPIPKIIDFGIAKLIDQSMSNTIFKTRLGTIMGTPGYMSPEQAGGKREEVIDTRTDVFSLGVLLYELLIGVTPLDKDLKGAGSLQEICHIIEKGSPRKPSSRVAEDPLKFQDIAANRGSKASELRHQLETDLDSIVMKAIAWDPELRYQSCAQFSNDIQLFLSGLPVSAGPPGFLYPLKKFVFRHRVPVLVASLLLVLFAGSFTLTTILLVRAKKAETRTEKTLSQLTTVNTFVENIFENIDPYRERSNVTGLELLERASARIDQDYHDQPEVEASLRMVMGRSLQRLGFPEIAQAHIQEAYRIRQQLFGEADLDTLDSLRRLASVEIDLGDYESAITTYRACLAHSQAYFGVQDPKSLNIANGLALALAKNNESGEALILFKQTLADQETQLGETNSETVATRNNYANLLNDLSDYSEAELLHRKNLLIRKVYFGDESPGTLSTMHNLALTLQGLKNYQDAETLARETLALRGKVLGNHHPDTIMTLNNLATMVGAQNRKDEALILLAGVIPALDEEKKEHPSVLLAMHNFGHFLKENGDLIEAEKVLRQTLEARKKVLGRDHQSTLITMATLAETLQEGRDFQGAEKLFRSIVQISDAKSSRENRALYNGLLGSCLTQMGQFSEAKTLLQQSHLDLVAENSRWAGLIESFLKKLERELTQRVPLK